MLRSKIFLQKSPSTGRFVRKITPSTRPERTNYWKEKRATEAKKQGRIPGIGGRPRYLTIEEEETLISKIHSWANPLTQPTVAGIAAIVSFSLLFFFLRNIFQRLVLLEN
jgi:hypothetical protein